MTKIWKWVFTICAAGVTSTLLVIMSYRRRRAAKPQLGFKKVLADNTDKPFQHLSSDLESLQAVDKEQSHPLEEVTSRLTLADWDALRIFRDQAEAAPAADAVPMAYIDTLERLQQAAEDLAAAGALGVDLEHHHTRSYHGMTCLLQLSTGAKNYIIDALTLHDHVHLLRPIFADPDIVKVLHSGDNDVMWLQRDFRIYVANVFDTAKACRELGRKEHSLAGLMREYFGVFQDKRHQLADWRLRPLPQEMLDYAVADAHYLLFLAAALRAELEELGDRGEVTATQPLDRAFARSQCMAQELYNKTTSEAAVETAVASVMRRYQQEAGAAFAQAKTALVGRVACLCRWRDGLARRHDEGLQYTLTTSLLLKIAVAAPAAAADLVELVQAWKSNLATEFTEQGWNTLRLVSKDSAKICADLQSPPPAAQPLEEQRGGKSRLTRAEKRQLMAQKFSAKRQVYENCRMLSMEGELLCYCDQRKVHWYEAKGLGERICDDPPTIRLTFAHKIGDQDAGQEAFYTASRANRCVVCGSQQHLLRYRVVPACYRKNFPVHQKSHRSHDVLLLCFNCHETAHKASEHVKREIARDLGVPLLPPPKRGQHSRAKLPHPAHVRNAAIALKSAGNKMPTERRQKLEAVIVEYFGDDEDLPNAPHSGAAASSTESGSGGEGKKSSLPSSRINAALLTGLGPRQRKRIIAKLQEEATTAEEALIEGIPEGWPMDTRAESGAEAEQSSSEGGGRQSAAQLSEAGHMWHGRKVVEQLLDSGGDAALNHMVQRFRAAFVEATAPKHLPPFWKIDHNAARQFGEYSIYASESQTEEAA